MPSYEEKVSLSRQALKDSDEDGSVIDAASLLRDKPLGETVAPHSQFQSLFWLLLRVKMDSRIILQIILSSVVVGDVDLFAIDMLHQWSLRSAIKNLLAFYTRHRALNPCIQEVFRMLCPSSPDYIFKN